MPKIESAPSIDFKNKTLVITALKKYLNTNYTNFKKELAVNIKDSNLKFNDSQLRNGKIEVDLKTKTIIIKFPVTKTGVLTLDENFNVISFE